MNRRGFHYAEDRGANVITDRHGILLPEPLAYFLTWPTYGAWLPGDDRGWIQYHRGVQLPDPVKRLEARARMADRECRLNRKQGKVVETAIVAHCGVRNWKLHAGNCRSNHLHVVVTAPAHPDEVRNQLKAWSTRKLKEFERSTATSGSSKDAPVRARWWAARGSKRYINDEDSLEAAILYVRDAQGGPP
jgi:REP element-mobilizing transposase RayT